MQDHLTLLQPEGPTPGGAGVSSVLPPDLLEQVRGRVRLLAALLLTGQFVFTADTTMGYLVQHIHTPPRPPSEMVSTAIPPELDEVILACLAKDPAQRPQTATELSRRLADVAGAERWNVATARTWWDAHLPVSAGSPA